ncbi:MAG: PH domain-containing protein [Gammaproteobacteria bacterium]
MTDSHIWQRTSVFAALFFLVRQIKGLSKNALQASAPLAALLFAYQGALMSKLVIAAIALPVILALIALLQFWFFRFRITDDAILIRQGVLQKKQLDIKFGRIQGIRSEQNILYRPFGLVNVSFDTAGSAGQEGALPAVSIALSEQLQSKIAATEKDTAVEAGGAPQVQSECVVRLGWRDMLRIGLSDRRALVALALAGPLYEQLGSQGRRMVENYARGALSALGDLGVTAGVAVALTVVLSVAVMLAVVSIAAAFLRYHQFALTHANARLQTVGGLLTRHTSSMDTAKIQRLQFDQSTLLRLFGRWRVVFRQATSAGEHQSKSMTVPIALPDQLPQLAQLAVAPELTDIDLNPMSPRFASISPNYMRPRILVVGVLPAIAVTILTWPDYGLNSLWALAWLPFVSAYFFGLWRRYGVQILEDGLVLRSGLIGYRLDAFVLRKVQRVTVHQSWWQRRSGLGGMTIYLASGNLRLRYIDYTLACRLRDRILHSVESSQRSWF